MAARQLTETKDKLACLECNEPLRESTTEYSIAEMVCPGCGFRTYVGAGLGPAAEIALPLAAGLASHPLTVAVQKLLTWYRSRLGELTQPWWQIIPAQHGQLDKIDRVGSVQDGPRLGAVIHRIEPDRQNFKTWRAEGNFSDQTATLLFNGKTSHGTITMVGDASRLRGIYTRVIAGRLLKFNLEWVPTAVLTFDQAFKLL